MYCIAVASGTIIPEYALLHCYLCTFSEACDRVMESKVHNSNLYLRKCYHNIYKENDDEFMNPISSSIVFSLL